MFICGMKVIRYKSDLKTEPKHNANLSNIKEGMTDGLLS